jgi:hypothetical protein
MVNVLSSTPITDMCGSNVTHYRWTCQPTPEQLAQHPGSHEWGEGEVDEHGPYGQERNEPLGIAILRLIARRTK